jgi:hypothetical protein
MAHPASSSSRYASPEQLRYAGILGTGTLIGFVLLVGVFVAYMSGWVTPLVPPEQLVTLWKQPVHHYLAVSGQGTGWGWLAQIHRSDVANLLGIAWLATISMPALLVVMTMALRQGDRRFALLALAEVAVLGLAASGILGGGH